MPNVLFLAVLLFFQWVNALMSAPKLRSFMELSQLVHTSQQLQKWKVTFLIWAQILAIQFLSLAFIT